MEPNILAVGPGGKIFLLTRTACSCAQEQLIGVCSKLSGGPLV